MALLELKDVNTYYGAVHALRGISLKVEEGEIVTLIGSNGAGKTTTLRTISGLERARSGSITVNGKSIESLPPHERPRLTGRGRDETEVPHPGSEDRPPTSESRHRHDDRLHLPRPGIAETRHG